MEGLADNSTLSPEARGDVLLRIIRDKAQHNKREETLPLLAGAIRNPSPEIRVAAITGYGLIGGRESYQPLVDVITADDDHQLEAIAALGKSQDSRALFTLVNLYHSRPLARDMTIHTLTHLYDPRAQPFLEDLLKAVDDDFTQSLAQLALDNLKDTGEFIYTFLGKEGMRTWPYDTSDHIDVTEKLHDLALVEDDEHPASYVVTRDYHFITAVHPRVEHVALAKGREVLAAGEYRLDHTSTPPRIIEINNRSYGYRPGETSLASVNKALRACTIKEVPAFTDVYPKDGYFTPEFLKDFPFFTPESPQSDQIH